MAWEIGPPEQDEWYATGYEIRSGDQLVAVVFTGDRYQTETPEGKANGLLVVSSPDMLSICQRWIALEDECDNGPMPSDYDKRYLAILTDARAVVDKATGG